MKKQISERAFNLRLWQQEAFREVLNKVEQGKKDFLCVATPGAGKTKFALTVAHRFLLKKYCDRIVIITPSDHLKRQWAEDASFFAGFDIDPDFNNAQGIEASDYYGIAITYALIGQDKKQVQTQNTFSRKTFVIFDEVHHAGESLTWGDAVKRSFDNAVFRLSISGTAFRSDDAKIPFITYDDNNVSLADYTYSYERAIKENVCRPVYFSVFDGNMKWKVDNQEFEHTFKDSIMPDQVSKRLKTALDPKGNYTRQVMIAADEKLTEIRKSHPDAAGLVFCVTQEHAKEICDMVQQMTGIRPPIVISSEGEGSEKIEGFKRSNDRWLISVKMVSEGVDIPRLRVGVYFTIVKAELFFRQAIGRFVRVLSHLKAQDAFIFIPQDRDLVKLAETIDEERDHALDEAERAKEREINRDLFGNEYTPALTGKFVPLGSEATENRTFTVNVELSSGMKQSLDNRHVIVEEDPVYIKKKYLKERINKMVRMYAKRLNNYRPDFRKAHLIWIENGGKNIEAETIDELRKREDFYRNLLRN